MILFRIIAFLIAFHLSLELIYGLNCQEARLFHMCACSEQVINYPALCRISLTRGVIEGRPYFMIDHMSCFISYRKVWNTGGSLWQDHGWQQLFTAGKFCWAWHEAVVWVWRYPWVREAWRGDHVLQWHVEPRTVLCARYKSLNTQCYDIIVHWC